MKMPDYCIASSHWTVDDRPPRCVLFSLDDPSCEIVPYSFLIANAHWYVKKQISEVTKVKP